MISIKFETIYGISFEIMLLNFQKVMPIRLRLKKIKQFKN